VFAAQFPDPEARSEFYRQIGERGNAVRLVLSADEAAVLAEVYALLGKLADRLPRPQEPTET
jgi:hypothetical protein